MKPTAHKHTFDIHPTRPTAISCTICGFSASAIVLKSKVNLDAWTARQHCTQAVLDLLGQSHRAVRDEEGGIIMRRIFSGSRFNRDRRDDAFARAVIAIAEQRRQADEALEAIKPELCIMCGDPLTNDEHHPYCSARCGIDAELDS